MKNTLWLAKNMLMGIFRRKSNILVFFIMPLLSLLLVMFLYSQNNGSDIRIGIIDKDKSILSKNYIEAIKNQGGFKLSDIEEKDISKDLSTSIVDCVVIIPSGFENSIYNNAINQPELVSIKGEAVTALVNNFSNIYLRNMLDIWEASGGDKAVYNKIYSSSEKMQKSFNISTIKNDSEVKIVTTQSIGFLIMFMMLGASILSELIIKEKVNRTYFRICSSPVSSKSFVLANILSNFVMIIIQVLLIIIVMIGIMKYKIYMPIWQLFVILLIFGIVAISLGILIVSFSKDTRHSNALALLIITPSCLMSGCYFPTDFMPQNMQKISEFLPQYWIISAIRKLQETGDIMQVSTNLGILFIFAATFFIMAAYNFSRNENLNTFV